LGRARVARQTSQWMRLWFRPICQCSYRVRLSWLSRFLLALPVLQAALSLTEPLVRPDLDVPLAALLATDFDWFPHATNCNAYRTRCQHNSDLFLKRQSGFVLVVEVGAPRPL